MMENSKIPKQETLYIKLGPRRGPFWRSEYLRKDVEKFAQPWDLKGKTEIVQIFLSYGDSIESIQFQYVDNGRLVISPIFGDPEHNGLEFQAVKLDHPSEYITGIAGYATKCVDNLTIYTNKGSYGPFGNTELDDEKSQRFSFQFGPDNQFGGFHGLHFPGLEGIGVYVKPISTLVPTTAGNTL